MWRQHGNALLQPASSSSPSSEAPQRDMVRPTPTATASPSWWVLQKYAAPPAGASRTTLLQPFQPLSSLYISTTAADGAPTQEARRAASSAAAPSAVSSANSSTLSLSHAPPPPHHYQILHHQGGAPTISLQTTFDHYPHPNAASPPSNSSHLVHSRFLPSSSVDDVAERVPRSASAEDVAAVLQDRVASTMAVNLSLQQELDTAKHEVSRLRVDNSRLRDHVSALQAQDQFLKSQLASVVARQQELLSFEHSPEGQGRRDVLEQQNLELRQVVQFKEDELRTMQQRLQEACRRVAHLEASAAHAVVRPLPTTGGATSTAISSEAAAAATASANRTQTLCSALEFAGFVLRGLRSARHVFCAPHRSVGAKIVGEEVPTAAAPVTGGAEAVATCGLTQRACAMRCLERVTKGVHFEDSATAHRSKTIDELMEELHEVVLAQHSVLVNTSNELAQQLLSSEFDVMMSGGVEGGEGRASPQVVAATSRQASSTDASSAPQTSEPPHRVLGGGEGRALDGDRANRRSGGGGDFSIVDGAWNDSGPLTGARSGSQSSRATAPTTTTTTTTHELQLSNGERRSVMVERQASPTGAGAVSAVGMPRSSVQQGDVTPTATTHNQTSRHPPTMYPPRRSAPSASSHGAPHQSNPRASSGCEHQ